LEKLIVTFPALALRLVLENLSCPDGSALSASPLLAPDPLELAVGAGVDAVEALAAELELELEPPQAPRPMATAAVATTSEGSLGTVEDLLVRLLNEASGMRAVRPAHVERHRPTPNASRRGRQ
jgi:hypothetical protein